MIFQRFQTFTEMIESRCGTISFAGNEIYWILDIITDWMATEIFRSIIDRFIAKLATAVIKPFWGRRKPIEIEVCSCGRFITVLFFSWLVKSLRFGEYLFRRRTNQDWNSEGKKLRNSEKNLKWWNTIRFWDG